MIPIPVYQKKGFGIAEISFGSANENSIHYDFWKASVKTESLVFSSLCHYLSIKLYHWYIPNIGTCSHNMGTFREDCHYPFLLASWLQG
jgi:hypothetical protein